MRSKQVSVKREIRPLRSTWRGLETWHGRDAVTPRNRKGEETGNTNCDLNRRASLRPYRRGGDWKREHGRDAVTPRNRKGEATGNTNSDLNRRVSLRPYLRGAGGETPPANSPHQLELGGQHDGQIRWPSPLENSAAIDAGLPID